MMRPPKFLCGCHLRRQNNVLYRGRIRVYDMNDSLSNDPRIDQAQRPARPQYGVGSEWSGGEMQPPLESAVQREKILPRRVLIKWALVTLALYFGLHAIGTVFRHTVDATVGGITKVASPDDRTVVYKTRSGRIITVRKGPAGSITISGGRTPAEPTPPQTPPAAEKAPPPAPATNASPAKSAEPAPAPTKR